jgi:integrase
LALSAGMRGGEIFALQPDDYDSETGTLAIRKTLVNNGTQIGSPKSKHSYRKIRLASVARDALDKHLLTTNAQWIFPSRTGTNLRYHNFIRFHWRPLLKNAAVDYKSFHTCRHYVASTLIGENVPLSAVARYLGDNEVTILRTYSHLIDGMQGMAAAAMDNALA